MGRPRKAILSQSAAPPPPLSRLTARPADPPSEAEPASPAADTDNNTPAEQPSPQDDAPDTSASKPPTDAEGTDNEGEGDPEDPSDEDDAEPVPEPTPIVKRKRGRPPRNPALFTPTKSSTPAAEDDDPLAPPPAPGTTSKKRRGRPPVRGSLKSRGGPSHLTAVPLDKDGNVQRVENDEIVLPPDPAGEAKVTPTGHLLGGREYRCRTFTIKGRGATLYMLSTEPARCIGFRDSYLFFQKHKQLYKIIMDDDEKFDMIARNLIPHSYKGRAIGVVTARSVFREFGARIVVAGRRITDDYWEQKARDDGAVEGSLADPDDKPPPPGQGEYNRNKYVAWHGASSVYHTGQPSVPLQMQSERHQGRMREKLLLHGGPSTLPLGGPGSRGGGGGGAAARSSLAITDENWMLEHARSASIFNSELRADRERGVLAGVYEPHTNLMFWPASTQSTRAKWRGEGEWGGGRAPQLPRGMYTVTHAVARPAGCVAGGYPYLGMGAPWGGRGMREVSGEVMEALRGEFGEEMVERVRAQARREGEWEGEWRGVGMGQDKALGGG